MRQRQIQIIAACALLAFLSACHGSGIRRALSPLVGSWQINGDTPSPDANYPRFTSFTFHRNGTVEATYVAASGALAGIVKMNPKVQRESDTFTLIGQHGLRIIEGARALQYRYDIHDGKLFLRTSDSDTSQVFTREDASDTTSGDATPTPDPDSQ